MAINVNGTAISTVNVNGTVMNQVYCNNSLVHCNHLYNSYQDLGSMTHRIFCSRPNCQEFVNEQHSWGDWSGPIPGNSYAQECFCICGNRQTRSATLYISFEFWGSGCIYDLVFYRQNPFEIISTIPLMNASDGRLGYQFNGVSLNLNSLQSFHIRFSASSCLDFITRSRVSFSTSVRCNFYILSSGLDKFITIPLPYWVLPPIYANS